MKRAFLVSASRSGSTMMSAMLRQHPDVLSLSELISMQGARALLPGKISGKAYWRQISHATSVVRNLANPTCAPDEFLYNSVANGRFDPFDCPPILAVTLPHLFDDPDAFYDRLSDLVPAFVRQTRADHHCALVRVLAAQTGQQFWVERSGGNLFATATLARNFPNAKFAVMLRDGRDVALSMQRYSPVRFMIWGWKLAKTVGVDLFKPGAHIGCSRWMALVEKAAGHILTMQRIMDKEPALADCAAFWSALTICGLKQIGALPEERRMIVRYETMVRAPRTELSRLARFLNIPADEIWLANAAKIPRRFNARYLSLAARDQEWLGTLTAAAREYSDSFA